MQITVGTFNLNNLFSRYNFQAEVELVRQGGTAVEADVRFTFVEPVGYRFRSYQGQLVHSKTPADRKQIADRIRALHVDVLAVQEVEDIGVLRQFALEDLGGLYPYQVLVEGNDQRLIDVGLLSRFPIGAVTSWRFAVHPEEPRGYIFSRDLLEVEILEPRQRQRLLTVFNTHLKSNYSRWGSTQEQQRIVTRRRRQAETIASIVAARTRPDSSYLVTGDMNDGADAECLAAFRQAGWVNGLASPQETRPAKRESVAAHSPPHPAWTHRFKPRNQPPRFELYDQIWLSPTLANCQTAAWIDRRTRHPGDGSDHDPAWVILDL
ncbi:MAG: endonuclease/exonuclease/phosphatase family protein [Caldilinea sp.]|jgi:endonuclease/exonuclease/phosphatase family metal-dependent hydrolase